MDISQERLNELISCPKDITPSQRQKFEGINGSRRLNLKLYSEKTNLYFQIFRFYSRSSGNSIII